MESPIRWTFEWFSGFDYQSTSEHLCTSLCMDTWFHLGKYLGVEFLGQETAKPIPQQWCQHLILSVFLILATLVGVSDDVEPLSMCSLGMSSFVKRLFKYFSHYTILLV